MSYSFDQYIHLVARNSELSEDRGGSEHVYVPGTGEIKDAQDLVPGLFNLSYGAFTMYHRLVAAAAVDVFNTLIEDMADGDPVGAVGNMRRGLEQVAKLAEEWDNFTNEYRSALEPGGC